MTNFKELWGQKKKPKKIDSFADFIPRENSAQRKEKNNKENALKKFAQSLLQRENF